MNNSNSIKENIAKLSNISAKLLERIEAASSSDIFAPKALTNQEKILFLHLGIMGQELFYDETTKVALPEELRGNSELTAVWYTAIKKANQKRLYSKAKNILYDLFDKIEKEKTTTVGFNTEGLSHSEVATLLHLAQLEGLHVDWDALDHSFCDIHTEWNCTFKLGAKVKHEEVLQSMVKKCEELKIIKPNIPLTDKEILNGLSNANNANV